MYCISSEQRFERYDIDLVERRVIQSVDDERFKYLGVLEKVVKWLQKMKGNLKQKLSLYLSPNLICKK